MSFYLSPYKVSERSELFITYELNAIYSWWQIFTILLFLITMTTGNTSLYVLVAVSYFAYLLITMKYGRPIALKIKSAQDNNSLEITGSRFSFKNPARYRILRGTVINPRADIDDFPDRIANHLRVAFPIAILGTALVVTAVLVYIWLST